MAAAGGSLVAHVDFPVYFIKMVSNRHFVVGGGGGESKTGVSNALEIFELQNEAPEGLKAKGVSCHGTGSLAPMNCAVALDEARCVNLACGQGGTCYLYRLTQKIVTPKRAEEGTLTLRKRKSGLTKSEDFKNAAKMVSFDVQPLDTVETDFSDDGGFQKCAAFTKNCSLLATAGADGYVRVWKLPEMKKQWERHVHNDEVDGLDIDPEGTKIVTVSRDGKVGLWRLSDGSTEADLVWTAPAVGTTCTKYNPKGCRFGLIDKRQDAVCLYTTHTPAIRSRKPQSSYIVSWDLGKNVAKKAVATGNSILSALDISNDGTYIGVGTLDGDVAVYDSKYLNKVYAVRNAHRTFVTGLTFAPDSEETRQLTGCDQFTLLTISVDNQIKAHRPITANTVMRILVLVAAALVATLVLFLCMIWGTL